MNGQFPGAPAFPGAPQMPQQQPQYPAQAPAYWPTETQSWPGHGQQPQQPPAQYPQQQPQQQPQQPMGAHGAPMAVDVNPNAMQAANAQYDVDSSRRGGGPFAKFCRHPDAMGNTKWENQVPIGYENKLTLWICHPWSPQAGMPFHKTVSHWYMGGSKPRGANIGCIGDGCKVCAAAEAASKSGNAQLVQTAANWGRRRIQYFYNVINMSNPNEHLYDDGIIRALIYSMGTNLHGDMKRLVEARAAGAGIPPEQGWNQICHIHHGRRLQFSKKKTGPDKMNVEYGVFDIDNPPVPLDPQFHVVLQNLWDLSEQIKDPTDEEVYNAINDMGLPYPGMGQSFGQVPQSFNPNPNPPHANPWGQQAPAQNAPPAFMPGQAPAMGQPPSQTPWQQPPPQQQQPAQQWPQQQPQQQPAQQWPQQQPAQQPQQPAWAQPSQGGPPPAPGFNPPAQQPPQTGPTFGSPPPQQAPQMNAQPSASAAAYPMSPPGGQGPMQGGGAAPF